MSETLPEKVEGMRLLAQIILRVSNETLAAMSAVEMPPATEDERESREFALGYIAGALAAFHGVNTAAEGIIRDIDGITPDE